MIGGWVRELEDRTGQVYSLIQGESSRLERCRCQEGIIIKEKTRIVRN
jgi:hypothetical protein